MTLEALESCDYLATITVQNTVAGQTPEVLGYNLGHFMPNTNAADWWRYEGVKAVRAFISPSDIEPTDDIAGTGDGVSSSTTFFSRRTALRANAANPAVALDNGFINWPVFQNKFANDVRAGSNYTVDFAFSQLRAQGVEILANITAIPSRLPVVDDNDWANKMTGQTSARCGSPTMLTLFTWGTTMTFVAIRCSTSRITLRASR